MATSFENEPPRRLPFLTGELLLTDAQWDALVLPWLPVGAHADRGTLDLMVAAFDERSGANKRLSALRGGVQRSTCHADEAPA